MDSNSQHTSSTSSISKSKSRRKKSKRKSLEHRGTHVRLRSNGSPAAATAEFSSQVASEVELEGEYYRIHEILDERPSASDPDTNEVLVAWVGDDPQTGQPYEPTWVLRSDCTPDVLKEWDRTKRARSRIPDSQSSYHESASQDSPVVERQPPLIVSNKRKRLSKQTGSSALSTSNKSIFDFSGSEEEDRVVKPPKKTTRLSQSTLDHARSESGPRERRLRSRTISNNPDNTAHTTPPPPSPSRSLRKSNPPPSLPPVVTTPKTVIRHIRLRTSADTPDPSPPRSDRPAPSPARTLRKRNSISIRRINLRGPLAKNPDPAQSQDLEQKEQSPAKSASASPPPAQADLIVLSDPEQEAEPGSPSPNEDNLAAPVDSQNREKQSVSDSEAQESTGPSIDSLLDPLRESLDHTVPGTKSVDDQVQVPSSIAPQAPDLEAQPQGSQSEAPVGNSQISDSFQRSSEIHLVDSTTLDKVEDWLSATQSENEYHSEDREHTADQSIPIRPDSVSTRNMEGIETSSQVEASQVEAEENVEFVSATPEVPLEGKEAAKEGSTETADGAPHALAEGLVSRVIRLPDNSGAEKAVSLNKYLLREAEYAVPIGFTKYQRHLYEQVLMLHSSEIIRFCDFGSSTAAQRKVMGKSMMLVLTRALLACVHPFLLVPALQPRSVSDKDESRYIVNSGSKLQMIDNIVTVFKDAGLKVAIIAREGQAMDLIISYLAGKRVKYAKREGEIDKPADSPEDSDSGSEVDVNEQYEKINVIVVPSSAVDENNKKKKFNLPRVDLVIAVDFSFVASEPQVLQLRGVDENTQSLTGKPIVPVLRFVPSHSAEHALICAAALNGGAETELDVDMLCSVMATFTLMRSSAGELSENLKQELAELPSKLPQWLATTAGTRPPPVSILFPHDSIPLTEDEASQFTIREIPPDYDNDALSLLSESTMASELLNVLEADNNPPLILQMSRTIGHTLKLIRRADAAVRKDPLQEQHEQHELAAQDIEMVDNGPDIAEERNEDEYEKLSVIEKEKLINDLNDQLMAARINIKSLESQLFSFKDHHMRLLERFEDTDRIMQSVQEEKTATEKRAEEANARIARAEDEKTRLKTELEKLKEKLKASEQALLDGPPPLAELQRLRTKTEQLEDEIRKLNHKLKSRDDDMRYMREEFEKAKKAGDDAVVELETVTAQNEALKKRIEDDVRALKAERSDEEIKAKDAKIKELNSRVLALEENIKTLQIDKQSGRGRYGVRSSSVPRRGLSPAARSRGSSPASGGATSASTPTSHPLQHVRGA
ncbi:class II histone deacetylase complex subunits 2 and 3-domain-containing protein [Myxozyma melibiosi]|uniref:Class II histone deacetylase complex subunits 2 and 3-domain-containing protein n=1 Tax=Myxozyma melibiosi TaxID=54550 RepID=A0ABR1FDB1_9ASCO